MILPVVIMSYNRPELLEQVLQSITVQAYEKKQKTAFFLAQDFHNSKSYDKCIQLAKNYLGKGLVILKTGKQLGVAKNFDRAERYIFLREKFEYALFLEDDLVLAPQYFALSFKFIEYMNKNQNVGMMAGRGNRSNSSFLLQERFKHRLIHLDEHNWGFVLSRSAWLARQKLLEPYLNIILRIPYRERNQSPHKEKLNQIKREMGYAIKELHTSQDSFKNAAMYNSGFIRLCTFTNNAQYIGKDGEHSNSQKFFSQGHGSQTIYNKRAKNNIFETP